MRSCHFFLTAVMLVLPPAARSAWAQSTELSVELVLEAGRPLRVALDRRIIVKRVGQPVTATLVEPVYVYDRMVVPVGTSVIGRVEAIESVPRRARVRAMMAGSFSPARRIGVQFDTLVLSDGRRIPIRAAATEGAETVVLRIAGESGERGVASRVRQKVQEEAKQTASVVTKPNKLERVKDAAFRALPYHPQLLSKGTVYSARLLSSVNLGSATPISRAPEGAAPAPDSILNARLATPVDSGKSRPGAPIEAVLTRPVFSADGQLILPEGTSLMGEVTFARQARRFHRHGQLRFLFETVHAPDRTPETLLASLFSVESSARDRVSVDEEGGATSTSPKSRLAAPVLAALAMTGTMHGRLDYDTDGAGPEMAYGGVGSSTVGGFLGLGLFGVALNQLGRPLTIATGAVALARTVYSSVFAKGREISFPADTPIQVRLAPRPNPTPDEAAPVNTIRDNRSGAEIDKLDVEKENGIAFYDIEFKADQGEMDAAQQLPTFRTETRLVVLSATVKNSHGELVTDLDREAFTVCENGKRQPITHFRRDDIPVSIGLVIDNSGSMREVRASVEAAALAFVRASNPLDDVFVVNFADKARIDVPMTADIRVLEAGIARVDSIGGTAMRDAVVLAEGYLRQQASRDRRVLLLITDGNDNASTTSIEQLRRTAEQSAASVFAVGLFRDDSETAARGRHELNELTKQTGGVAYYPDSIDRIDAIVIEIAHQIRNEYTIAYTPLDQRLDGSYRTLQVRAAGHDRLSVLTRSGYWASANPVVIR